MNWRITWHALVIRPEAMKLINHVSCSDEGYPQSHMQGDIEGVKKKVDELSAELAKLGCNVTLVEIDTVYQPVVP